MKESGLALLATAVIKQALYEEGWNYLDSPEGKFYMDIANKKPVDFQQVFEKIKETKKYRQNLEKNADKLRNKLLSVLT